MERYRSGHNEAVLKTVCPQGRVGSNPTLSACQIQNKNFLKKLKKYLTIQNIRDIISPVAENDRDKYQNYLVSRAIWRTTQAGRRGSPGKGVGR